MLRLQNLPQMEAGRLGSLQLIWQMRNDSSPWWESSPSQFLWASSHSQIVVEVLLSPFLCSSGPEKWLIRGKHKNNKLCQWHVDLVGQSLPLWVCTLQSPSSQEQRSLWKLSKYHMTGAVEPLQHASVKHLDHGTGKNSCF